VKANEQTQDHASTPCPVRREERSRQVLYRLQNTFFGKKKVVMGLSVSDFDFDSMFFIDEIIYRHRERCFSPPISRSHDYVSVSVSDLFCVVSC
jgi:hypothetical protein